jgi:hypothetical protein
MNFINTTFIQTTVTKMHLDSLMDADKFVKDLQVQIVKQTADTTTPVIFTTLLAIDAFSTRELTISRWERKVRPLPRKQRIIYKPRSRHKLVFSSLPPAHTW